MKIVVLDGYTENPGDLSWEALGKLGELTVYDRTDVQNPEEIISRIGDAEVAITNKAPISASAMDACRNLKYIAILATGYNVVDVNAARQRGIPVSNVPSYGTAAVGQFAIAMLLEICHHVAHHSQTVFDGKWNARPDWCYWDYPLIELDGKTMGIIGFGRIGQQTGKIARAMGMHILAYDSHPNESGRAIAEYVYLDTLLGCSDVIALHCPLFPETEGIINRNTIAKMKDGVILLNNSRGQLLVEQDVAEALNSGKIYAAGLIASYETEHPDHYKSAYLHGDSLRKMIDECHARGIRVIARTDFSKVHESLAAQHPDWLYRDTEGNVSNYNGFVQVCMNGEYQQKIMFEILQELLTTHPFDGLFCNMSGFLIMDYSGKIYPPCQCESCKRLFRQQYGEEIPQSHNFSDPIYLKYNEFKGRCTAQHKQRLHALVQSISPEIAMNGFEYQRSESNVDIGRPAWPYSASSNSRIIRGIGNRCPVDNASTDFIGFRYRDISVSPQLMKLRQWQNLANGGAVSLFIMGTLENHLDTSGFAPTREVFAFHKAHEEMYTHMVSAARVVLLRAGNAQRPDPKANGWVRALTESHVPFDELVVSELNSLDKLSGKTHLILGDIRGLGPKQAEIVDSFACGGGTVIATGATSIRGKNQALNCLGVESVKETRRGLMSSMLTVREGEDFPSCRQAPYLAIGPEMVIVRPTPDTVGYLRLVEEHPFGPPELCYFTEISEQPGILVHSHGKGKGIYAPFKLATLYFQEGYENSLNLLQDLLFTLGGIPKIAPELTPMVELVLDKWEEKTVVQLINNSGIFANSYGKPLPVRDIVLDLGQLFRHIQTLNGGVAKIENGKIHLDVLCEYEAIILS